MPKAPTLRDATFADLHDLLDLEALFPGDRISARQMRHHLRARANVVRIAEDESGLLGYALLLLRRDSDRARLYSLVVAPAARGRGIGASLLRDAETQARQRGRRRIGLEVRADNAAAIALYRAAGYRELTMRPGYYDDGTTARRFERSLGGP